MISLQKEKAQLLFSLISHLSNNKQSFPLTTPYTLKLRRKPLLKLS